PPHSPGTPSPPASAARAISPTVRAGADPADTNPPQASPRPGSARTSPPSPPPAPLERSTAPPGCRLPRCSGPPAVRTSSSSTLDAADRLSLHHDRPGPAPRDVPVGDRCARWLVAGGRDRRPGYVL